MTGISEEYITEAALVPALGASPAEKPESRFAALSHVLNSGWGVACICFIVAIAAVVGMVAWGRMGEPVGPGYTPPAEGNFSFSHSVSFLSGPVPVGTDLRLDTSVKNEGAPFTYEGSSTGFAPTAALVHTETGYSIEGYFPMTKDYVTFTVNTGDVGTCVQTFSIPEDAPTGVYDLVLSYGGERQVFSRMVSVVLPIDPPVIYSDYSFGYEPFEGFAIPGDRLTIETWVRNDGYLFTSMGFAPAAVLVHSDTGYRIEGMFDVTEDYTEVTVNPGDVGRVTQEFFIPADAPTGDYALELSHGGVSQSFAGVLTVAVPTDTALEYPLLEDGHPFSFGYEPFGGFAIPGDMLTVEAWVVNEGDPFSFVGDPYSYQPTATLYHIGSDYTIGGISAPTGVPPRPCNVLTGQKGGNSYAFSIPTDAPTGVYGLRLSYNGAQETFDNVLTVAVPIVEEPTVLSNLTMAVGEEWLYEPIEEAYVPGEKVTVRFKFATDMEPLLILNGAFVESKTGGEQQGYWEYSFTMPDQDSAIYFHTYDKTLPYANMLESCIAWDHYNFSEKEFYYYGEFGNGVMVALLLGNGEQVTGTSVGLYQFITPTTHELLAYYNGGLYWLEIAYEDYELLTKEDLADLFSIHKSLFPDCYDNWPSPK